ncbi:hypothetical protein LL936_05425 [Levilactobacillus brevis]|uniref:hypothetical protein n=1 Tax=Levilactobacillus brevis TaxID=1580 RepID=UPI00114247A1|nr:hypothetical protein [Levilactobacillus brevis]MBU7539549.1 hypothetical protein [Levilactobacillus brevis]MBU7559170.1 hypothetical protein [Levilactobacillus brevis]MBU7565720.1 hypothetical protein [Levilactobacillus brevis]MCE6010704.1 hypothetical protein [Levilactobacillus brevis]MCE6013001.1 hypothetical protein [Levilactobacillus brevis]
MKKEEFQAAVLAELRNLNKTLKIIASNQERHETSLSSDELSKIVKNDIRQSMRSVEKELPS